jgi:hypothetical protein
MPNPVLADLTKSVSDTVGVMQSAEVALNGVAARIQAAVDAAIANGATADELKPVQDEVTALNNESSNLAAAVANQPK